MVLAPFEWYDGEPDLTAMYDAPMSFDASGRWSVEISSAPPADHLIWEDDDGEPLFLVGQEIPLVYLDVGAPGFSFSSDIPLSLVCHGADPVIFGYLAGSLRYETLLQLAYMGWPTGWYAMDMMSHDEPTFLDRADLTDLSISETCMPTEG
jgi:hypothetical protein